MKNLGSHNWLVLLSFIAGGILGGIVGEALYVPALQGVLPALTQHYEIRTSSRFTSISISWNCSLASIWHRIY